MNLRTWSKMTWRLNDQWVPWNGRYEWIWNHALQETWIDDWFWFFNSRIQLWFKTNQHQFFTKGIFRVQEKGIRSKFNQDCNLNKAPLQYSIDKQVIGLSLIMERMLEERTLKRDDSTSTLKLKNERFDSFRCLLVWNYSQCRCFKSWKLCCEWYRSWYDVNYWS